MKRTVVILLLMSSLAACGLLDGDNEKKLPGKIVFSTLEADDGHYQLFVMNTDGSDKRQLTHFENDRAVQPAWSPDGRQIVFVTSLRSSTAGGSLYLMNADGTNIRPMKERPGSNIVTPGSHPRWSPDGTKIAFDWCGNCESGGNNYEIYVYDLQQDSIMQVTDHPASDSNPVWGSTGSKIAFISNRNYLNADTLRFRRDLYTMDRDGSNQERLTTTGYARELAWHPDGNTITYRSSRSFGELFHVDISTKTLKKVKILENVERSLIFPVSYILNGIQLLVISREVDYPRTNNLYMLKINEATLNNVFSKPSYNNANPTILGADWIEKP